MHKQPEFCHGVIGASHKQVSLRETTYGISGCNRYKNSQRQLKDNADCINKEETYLLGDDFQNHLKAMSKAQESAEKLFGTQAKRQQAPSRPFRFAPHLPCLHDNQEGERHKDTIVECLQEGEVSFPYLLCQKTPSKLGLLNFVHPGLRVLFPGQ